MYSSLPNRITDPIDPKITRIPRKLCNKLDPEMENICEKLMGEKKTDIKVEFNDLKTTYTQEI
jgi:hypothetical protein